MRIALLGFALVAVASQAASSGPAEGEAVPPLKATVIVNQKGSPAEVKPDTDIVKNRGKKPTVYVFLSEKQWTNIELAGFLKGINGGMRTSADGRAVLVFTTDNPRAAVDYLERRAWIFDLPHTTMAVHDKAGTLKKWNLSQRTAVTAVVAHDGKVTKTFAFAEPADADATAVLRSIKAGN